MSKFDKNHVLTLWPAILSSVFSSLSVIFQIKSIQYLSPYVVASLALIIGALFFFVGFLVTKQFPKISLLRANLFSLVALIVLRCLAGNFLFVYSLSLTTGIKAMFFTKAEPYFVLFWYWILKKGSVKGKHIALLLLHVVGAIFLSTGGNFHLGKDQLGDGLILVAMACSSLSYFYGMDASHALGARATNAITQFCGGLILLPIALLYATPENWSLASPGWAYLAIHILLFNIIALTLWFKALRSIDAWIVSALRAIGPVVAAPLAWVFLGEVLNPIQIIAAVVVLLTSALIAREHIIASTRVNLDESE